MDTLRGHGDWVSGIRFSPSDGRLLASASLDGTVRIWDLRTSKTIHVLDVGTYACDVAFSLDGRTLAVGIFDGTTQLWNVPTGNQLLALKGHQSIVYSVAFSPDGNTLATGSHDRSILLWSLNDKIPFGAKRLATPFR